MRPLASSVLDRICRPGLVPQGSRSLVDQRSHRCTDRPHRGRHRHKRQRAVEVEVHTRPAMYPCS